MQSDTHAEVRAERAKLRHQVMIGYAIFHIDHAWDGHLYHRLHRAQGDVAHKPAGSEVVLVHATGTLYRHHGGEALGRLMTDGGKTHHLQVNRQARSRILKQRHPLKPSAPRMANDNPPALNRTFTGHRHTAYID